MRMPFEPPYLKEDLQQLDILHDQIGLSVEWLQSEQRHQLATIEPISKDWEKKTHLIRPVVGYSITMCGHQGRFMVTKISDVTCQTCLDVYSANRRWYEREAGL